ncbi:MAG TPA: hypothetical protein OIM45_01995 [Clostridiaceae bacterium]|jgi:hypothetical protein|nr:hypothetical protein [Clostridiaceae bacterium]
MEKELDSKIFFINDYTSKNNMEEHIKEYIRKLNIDHPNAIITKEFYRGKNILVRATEIKNNNTEKEKENQKEKEIDDWHIRQRGER